LREDLPRGVLAAQTVHAAGESSPGALPEGTYAVVLGVPNEAALLLIEERLCAFGIVHKAIREPDPPWCGALMAIGVVPVVDRKPVRRALGQLPLLK